MDPFFTQEEINELAKESGFVKRKGLINGSIFLNLIVFNSDNLKDQSLNDLSIKLEEDYRIDITKQSLHERFNKNAVLFLKNALEITIKNQFDTELLSLPNLKVFNRILIKDSTSFQIDESLAKFYPGSGGSGSTASIRIQYEYDILNGRINDLSVNAFNDQDAKDSISTIELTKKGDLIIRDLAYMTSDVLKYIADNERFFLCRANTNTYLYELIEGEYVKIDFSKISKYMRKNRVSMIEKGVYYGNKKLKVRLILHLLPEKEIEKRIRNAIKNNKNKGGDGNLSDEHKAKISLNLFITNIDAEQISAEHVWPLYRLRWQIELIFKIWKSICNIEKVKKLKKHRLECYIYSKLMLIVLGWQVIWKIAIQLFYNEGKVLSFNKAAKTLFVHQISKLKNVFFMRTCSLKDFMMNLYKISRKNHLLEKRKGQPTSMELLLMALTN